MTNVNADSHQAKAKNSFDFVIFTSRKRSLGQGNVFTGVCLSTEGGLPGSLSLEGGVYIQGGCFL